LSEALKTFKRIKPALASAGGANTFPDFMRSQIAHRAPLVSSLTALLALAAPLSAEHKLGPQRTSFQAPKIAAASDEGLKAIKRFSYPAGWKADLWSSEPDVAHGVAFHVADDGRVFVAESFRAWRGVPDIRGIMPWLDEDLACRSVDDRLAMMQRNLKPEEMAGYFLNTERVRLLRDTKGIGKADISTVFAENFATPLDGVASGVFALGKDVFFANIPNVWHLSDIDGDGIADAAAVVHLQQARRIAEVGGQCSGCVDHDG
jgi:quinoprotein glucose dehydrogenase